MERRSFLASVLALVTLPKILLGKEKLSITVTGASVGDVVVLGAPTGKEIKQPIVYEGVLMIKDRFLELITYADILGTRIFIMTSNGDRLCVIDQSNTGWVEGNKVEYRYRLKTLTAPKTTVGIPVIFIDGKWRVFYADRNEPIKIKFIVDSSIYMEGV